MTTREFQKKQPLSILFAYFKPHRGLFALDLVCATIVALIDLSFPMVTRKSMYDLLPQQQYRAFFVIMGVTPVSSSTLSRNAAHTRVNAAALSLRS